MTSTPATAVDLALVIERLERLAPLNAVVDVVRDPARAPDGALAGLPVAIKNIVDVVGLPTRMGSPAPAVPARTDAQLVARLRAAGAAVVASTQCLEWAAGFAHPAVGDTRNPYDLTLTAGGSSGGSAAVVATDAVPLAVGTDTGGSVRIPAAYCGVVGLKATTGLVPLDGVQALSPTLDCVGVFARSAGELWPAVAVMAGIGVTVPSPLTRPLVLGVLGDQFDDPSVVEPGRFAAALHRLAAAGVELRPLRGGWTARPTELMDALTVIVAREANEVHRTREGIDYAPGTRALIDLGATVSDASLAAAMTLRAAVRADVDASLAGVDALFGPTVGYPAPEENPPFGADDDTEGRFTSPYNLSGHPAVSLPLGGGRLPLGVQLAGRRHDDANLLAVAAHLQTVLGPVAPPELGS